MINDNGKARTLKVDHGNIMKQVLVQYPLSRTCTAHH